MLVCTQTKAMTQKAHASGQHMTDLVDFERIRHIADGDETALHELYAAYGQRLYAYALSLIGDPAGAEDVVQDTLVIVWRSAGKFRSDGRVVAWLLGIIHHTAMKSLRHRAQPLSEDMEEHLSDTGPTPEDQIQSSELTRALRQGLQALSPQHRAVLELVFYQGLSLEETARVCKCPLGTVKSRLSYARQSLRGIMSRQNEEEWR